MPAALEIVQSAVLAPLRAGLAPQEPFRSGFNPDPDSQNCQGTFQTTKHGYCRSNCPTNACEIDLTPGMKYTPPQLTACRARRTHSLSGSKVNAAKASSQVSQSGSNWDSP